MSSGNPAPSETPGFSPESIQEIVSVLSEVGTESGRDYAALFERVVGGQNLLEAMDLPPQTVDVLYAQAFARFDAQRIPEAMQLFQALTLLAPKVKDHWLGLAICLRMADQFEAARLPLDVAFSLAPDCPAVVFHRLEFHN